LHPGEFAVVVEDREAFSNRYQNATSIWYRAGIDVVGQWSGGLADAGELRRVLLVTTGSKAADLRRGAERPPGRPAIAVGAQPCA